MIALREPCRPQFENLLRRVEVAGQTYCGTRPGHHAAAIRGERL